MKWTATFAAAALSAALCAAPTANEDFVVAEAAAAYSNAVYTAGTNTTAAIAAESAALAAATNTLSAALSAAKQDKLPYPTNAIPQGAVSGLATALAGKLDNGGGTLYGSLYFEGEDRDEWGFINLYNAGEYPGGMTIGYKVYDRSFLFNSWDASFNMTTVRLPADKEGTVAFTSDIKPIPGKWALANITNNHGGAVTAADVGAYPVASGVALANRVSAIGDDATNYTDSAISAAISNTNPTFSNAVLAVGLNIDTNAVAVLNEIAADFGGFPLTPGSTATTVGGILAALAAAIAWLKKNKADAAALRYAFAATIQPTAGTAAPTGSLTDRAGNKVVCTEATGQTGDNAKLTLTLPPAVPGYVRDFLVKIDRTTSGCYSVDFVPYGNESVSYETADGSMPEVPDGVVTWLSFTENESGGVFTVRAIPLVAVTGGS